MSDRLLAVFLPHLSLCQEEVVFADDFSEPPGTAIIGKSPDVGSAWFVSSGTGGNPTISATNSFDTTGAARTAFGSFTKALGPGEILTLSYDTLGVTFGPGWVGVSLFVGGSERVFTGSPNNQNSWGVDNSIGLQVNGDTSTATSVVFTYAYDDGEWTFTTSTGDELSGFGAPELALDRVRIANGNPGHINVDNLEVKLERLPVELASVTSASVSHAGGFVFEISDHGTESVVSPADIEGIYIDGWDVLEDVVITKDPVSGITTITYTPPDPLAPYAAIPYEIVAYDQNDRRIERFGTVTTPVFPVEFFLTEAPALDQWNIREIRGAATGASIANAVAIIANPPATPGDDPPGTGWIEDYTASYFNISDDVEFGGVTGRGFFKRDAPYSTNNAYADPPGAAVNDDNIVGLGRTRIEIGEAGDYTFWVQSDDSFALRINGGTFHKVAGNGIIDPSDASTIVFPAGTANSNTRGTVHLDAGEYVIDFLWVEGGGGSFAEVAWSPGDNAANPATGRWKLVGGAEDSPFFPAGPLDGPEVPASGWAVRNYYGTGGVPGLRVAFDLVANPDGAEVANDVTPVVNFRDPHNPGVDGLFNNNIPFPLEAVAEPSGDDDHFVTVARHAFAAGPGDYTFAVTSDEGFAFRILGGPYLIDHAGPMNNHSGADPLDSSAFLNTAAHGDASYGVYRVTEPGTYIIEVVHVAQSGGSSLEVAWAPGHHIHRNSTSVWQLVGDPGDASLPPLVPVIPDDVFAALPRTEAGNWSIRFYYPDPVVPVNSLGVAFDVARNPASVSAGDFVPYLNHLNRSAAEPDANPGGNAQGLFRANQATAQYILAELPFLGPGLGVLVNDAVVLATARVVIPEDGVYTFGVHSDDGFALRIVGAPNGFKRLSGDAEARIDMAQPNTIYRTGNTAAIRAAIELTAGEYDIEFAYYERAGDGGFELFVAAGDFTNLGDTGNWSIIGAGGDLTLVAQVDPGPGGDVPSIGNFSFDAASGAFSFTWNSEETAAYQIEYSADLVTWYDLEVEYPGGEGSTTTYSGNVADLTEIESTEKAFFRLRAVE